MKINITIGTECIKCGKCVSVCPANVLKRNKDNKSIEVVAESRCISCGQCVAICPTKALRHSAFLNEKIRSFKQEDCPTAEQFLLLCQKRRSNRTFSGKSIPKDLLLKIIEAGGYAPTAHNSQDVKYVILASSQSLDTLKNFVLDTYRCMLKRMSNLILKPFIRFFHPEYNEHFTSMQNVVVNNGKGNDTILRGANAVILIYTDKKDFFGSANANLAYQNLSLMAETLGVGHFYSGHTCAAVRLRKGALEKLLGIDGEICAAMALGMPKFKFNSYLERDARYSFIE